MLWAIVTSMVALVAADAMAGEAAEAAKEPKLLFLLAQGFNRMEHFETLYSFTAMGYHVDVASFERGRVLLDHNNERIDAQGRDAEANLAMREITDISPYLALVIPGGYSPGNLEKDADALRLVREFDAAGKPIGVICHAARLLARSGVARGRVITGWNEIVSEIPETWVSGDMGTYVDQSVVVDGNIISCRFPDDVAPWLRVFVDRLTNYGGLPVPDRRADAVIFSAGKETGHQRQMATLGARNNNVNTAIVHEQGQLATLLNRDIRADVVLVYPEAESEALLRSESGQALLARLGNPPIHRIAENSSLLQLREAVAVALAMGHPLPEPETVVYDAVIAISPGFDDRVVAAMQPFLISLGFNPVIISHDTGWVRGLKGMPAFATATYQNPPKLAENLLVLAPGGLWPREDPNVRQADQPAWLAGQGQRDQRRADWVTGQYKSGALLITIGFDSLYLTADPVFADIAFAASEQIPYAFIWRRHSAGTFASNTNALRSAERIFSARGFDALPELMQLLNQPAAKTLLER